MSDSQDERPTRFPKLPVPKIVDTAIDAARKARDAASETSNRILDGGRNAVKQKYATIQSAFGEDYGEILSTNPLILDSLSHTSLLANDADECLNTTLNTPWMTATLWTAAAGFLNTFQHPTGRALGGMFHYGPGHVTQWTEINQYMDAVSGSGHRLKHGHSLDCLPDIVERFGLEGIPAFFCHLLQDFTTVDGLPMFPNAWEIKQALTRAGIAPRTATSLVSLSASNALAGLSIAAVVWKLWEQWERDKRRRAFLSAAESAALHRDYTGAIENFKRALEMDRSPATLIALGQVYLRRVSTRPYAHRTFADAVELLSSDHGRAIPYHGAQISLRGIAGMHALATADVIGDRYPEYWQEQVENLMRATIHSFASQAEKLEAVANQSLANSLARPPLLSAAINRYLAAHTACYYPLLDDREQLVKQHLTAAVSLLGRAAQTAEESLRVPTSKLAAVWSRTILPPDEAQMLLATT